MPSRQAIDPELEAAFARFWEADRPSQSARIALLRQAAGDRGAALDDEAARVAHGLGGVAAMYGFATARGIAFEIEQRFRQGGLAPDLPILIDQLQSALAAPYPDRA